MEELATMNPEYCNCNMFQKAVNSQNFRYYRPEDDSYNGVEESGWYIYAWGYQGAIASLKPFQYCPWCAKKLAKQKL